MAAADRESTPKPSLRRNVPFMVDSKEKFDWAREEYCKRKEVARAKYGLFTVCLAAGCWNSDLKDALLFIKKPQLMLAPEAPT
jgi:predicted NAD/FAD-binding protein